VTGLITLSVTILLKENNNMWHIVKIFNCKHKTAYK
jgi:hypothetical protein